MFQNLFLYGKRIFLFLALNFIIVMTLQILVINIIFPYFGIQLEGVSLLLVLYSVIGMGGAFISLWMSKSMAVRAMGVKLLKGGLTSDQNSLVQKVHYLSRKAGLVTMPEVGIYNAPDVNAFATGPSKNNSLVAVSEGLLNHMNEQEVEGVLAHEVAHIANGDMVTMTLIQGVVNTMVMLLAHLLASLVSSALSRGRRNFWMEFFLRQIFYSLLFIPGSLLTNAFSRWREYRADRGGAAYAGRDKMVAALQALQKLTQAPKPSQEEQYSYLKINNAKSRKKSFNWFSTHPPLEDRISRLLRYRSY